MTREQWERLKEIFNDAHALPLAERESFIREAAKDDAELLAEILRLVDDGERGPGLLSSPAVGRARALGGTSRYARTRDDAPQFSPDTILARRFRVIRFIARGGMGDVYEAEDLELGERIAVKAIRRSVAPEGQLLALFKNEIQMARRVTHANVCRIFDLAQHEDAESGVTTMLLFMQLLKGHTLAEHLQNNGALAFQDALPLIEDIAAGLQAVHDADIIHGDLKPGNVMLVGGPVEGRLRAVVMDFGMALPASPDSPGAVVSRGGTPGYFAPEQARGEPTSRTTDVYAFGLVIADMLDAPRPGCLNRGLERMPMQWARVLRRCFDADPARRFIRPEDVARALRSCMGQRARMIARVAAGSCSRR